jgi:hypothetical protein
LIFKSFGFGLIVFNDEKIKIYFNLFQKNSLKKLEQDHQNLIKFQKETSNQIWSTVSQIKLYLLDTAGSPILSTTPYRTVPYRTVPYRSVPYRTVPYRTVP